MTSNRVEKVLVTSGTQGAGISALTSKQFVVEVKGKAANSVVTVDDEFRISVKAPDGTILHGDWIKAKNLRKVSKEAAVAKAEQVTTITPGTLEADAEYNLTLIDVSDRELLTWRQNKRVYTAKADGTGDVVAVLNQLAADINSDQAAPVTATATATTLVLTAKSQQDKVDKAGIFGKQIVVKASFYKVQTFGSQSVTQGTVAVTTAPVFGKGQGYQVRKLEDGQTGTQGYLNRTLFPADQYPYGSDVSTDYFIYVFDDIDVHSTNSMVLNLTDAPRVNIVAAEADTDLDVIFANLI